MEYPKLTLVTSEKCFNGYQNYYTHRSPTLNCQMRVGIFLPDKSEKVPVIFCLGGLTSTVDSFPVKSGYQKKANELGLAIVCPDTSPRGDHVFNIQDDDDLGSSAGWYVNASKKPWSDNYRMFDYITKELVKVLSCWSEDETPGFLDCTRISVMGYSMGGHGALIAFLKTENIFTSCSCFAPVVSASRSKFGKKAFSQYFDDFETEGLEYDACELVKKFRCENQKFLLVDVGSDDEYLESDIMYERLKTACEGTNIYPQVNVRVGYNHSYSFVASFMDDHLEFHSRFLVKSKKNDKSSSSSFSPKGKKKILGCF